MFNIEYAEYIMEDIQQRYEQDLKRLNYLFKGKVVRINDSIAWPPQARGRIGIIDSLKFINGRVEFLCIIIKKGTNPEDRNFLRSSWSEMYFKFNQFKIIE